MNDFVLELLAEIERLQQANDRLTQLNRHYLHYFFGGDILRMKETFKYINDYK